MILDFLDRGRYKQLWLSGALLCALGSAWVAPILVAQVPEAVVPIGNDAGRVAYRQHLEALERVVAACQQQRNAVACDPALVGPNDHVQLNSNTSLRELRYGWLRLLLERAGKPQERKGNKQDVLPTAQQAPAPSIETLLTEARERLAEDLQQASVAASTNRSHVEEQKLLAKILTQREFREAQEINWREQLLEKVGNWIYSLLAHLAQFGAQSPWIAWAVRGLLIALICLALVWVLVRIERRSRLRLLPEMIPMPGVPSARDWQLWLADAQQEAKLGRWREAIHFLYWASISQLESTRMWAADCARTPREYLQLLPVDDLRREHLIALTKSFEYVWYGGHAVGEEAFQAALDCAAQLGVR